MTPITVYANHPRKRLATILGALLAAMLLVFVAAPAFGATDDDDAVDLPFTIITNVRSAGEPIPGVTITVEGDGYSGEAETNDRGQAQLGVPTKDVPWTIALDESTLPSGIEVPDGFALEREITFGASSTTTSNFTLSSAERVTATFWDQLASRTVNGLNFGLMLALAAIGLSLVYGTTGLSNFAHGEIVTFGAAAALLFASGLSLSIWLAIPLAIAASALFGWSMDAGIWRPLRRRSIGIVQLMIVSIGLSLALRYVFLLFMGGTVIQLPGGAQANIPGLGPIRLTVTDVISMAVSIVVIVGFALWLMRSQLGRATRAVSDNPSLAAASGINVDRVVRAVWIISSALAGLSGILWAYFRPGIRWDMGTGILLLMFAAVTLGGLGTAFGALVGSIIVGLIVEVSTLWIPSDLKYAGALVVLIVILLFRPQGILGRKERIG